MNFLILHGPNLNMLGKREKEHYGTGTQEDLVSSLKSKYPDMAWTLFQSNHEGELIDRIHKAVSESWDGIIINFGGFTHTSVAIRDALSLLPVKPVEVHLSNIHARESFRHTSLTGGVCRGMISGFGFYGYEMAAAFILQERSGDTDAAK
ncbi:type II 3-dehydroquinate dehydratase [Balneolaceae bacterium ANBcel3]|nr:type II 3-dehydroquinate dehydratase [Balneolaceae bacterium ANBcel3]